MTAHPLLLFFKSLLNLLQYCFCFMFCFWFFFFLVLFCFVLFFGRDACGILLTPRPRTETRDRTRTPCIGRRSLNHWTAREVPHLLLFKGHFCYTLHVSVGSVEVSGNPWKLMTFAMLIAFLSSLFFNYSVNF